jgi:hypothetical protein
MRIFVVTLRLSYDLRKTGCIKLNGKILGALPLLQEPRKLQSAKPLSL